ncbi:MAG: CPBP family intramembrane metalloprotease [Methanosphaera sp.]|nr:CPBP family intramembrane metalloprotease [Methanosphaera sp.]
MNQSQYFEFEDKKYDFPYYKNKEIFSKKTGLIMLLSVILFIILLFGPVKFKSPQEELILFLAMMIPFIIATGGKLGSLFKRPRLSDLKLVVLCVLGNLFLLLLIVIIQSIINTVIPFDITHTTQSFGEYSSITALAFIASLFQIISEELFRVIIFLIMLYLMYRFTKDRKMSIMVAVFFSLLLFGLMHANTYGKILFCIFVMGFGTFFTLYPYLKTKNILLSILVHMIYNLLVLIVQTSL